MLLIDFCCDIFRHASLFRDLVFHDTPAGSDFSPDLIEADTFSFSLSIIALFQLDCWCFS